MFFYNCSVFVYSTVAGRKSEINLVVIVIPCPSLPVINFINIPATMFVQLDTFKVVALDC